MKIGIMTFFRPINYGAYLQAYALSHRLNMEQGIEAEIINFYMTAEDEQIEKTTKLGKNIPRILFNRKRVKTFRNSLKFQILSKDSCCGDMDSFVNFADNKYDVIIAGSDEIWKVNGYRGFPTPYFLPGQLHCLKVSYAASGRTPFSDLSDNDMDLLRRYLEDFSYIGVRDEKTKNEIGKLLPEKELHINFDPTFIYDFKPDKTNGRALLNKYFNIDKNTKVIALMYNGKVKEIRDLEHYLKQQCGEDITFISLYDWNADIKACPDITPLEWKDIIAAIDGVVTMYFHGACLSIICGTPFYTIEKRAPNNEESKLYDLLCKLNLLDRYSLGLETAIHEDKMDGFIYEVKSAQRLNFTPVLEQAQEGFSEFVNEIRTLYAESCNQ